MAVNVDTTYLVAALLCASMGSVYDLRTRRIPNLLTGPSILFGLLLHLSFGGVLQLGYSLLGGLIAGAIFLLFFMVGGMGGGDVKLMAAVGCIAGLAHIKDVLIATVIVGGIMAIALALYRGQLVQTARNVMSLVHHHASEGLTEHPELNLKEPAALRLPYAIPIAAGCLTTFLLAIGKGWVR